MANLLQQALAVVLPKGKQPVGGATATPTFNASQPVLSMPTYQDHLVDIFNSRAANDSKVLMADLFRNDPDVSAAVNAYLTVADTPMQIWAYDEQGQVSTEGIALANAVLDNIVTAYDYSLGFQLKKSRRAICADFRYMLLLRGSLGAELVFDKKYVPVELRNVDMSSIFWTEVAGKGYKPEQAVAGERVRRSLDIPTFFVTHFRQSPTSPYSWSTFVSAVNSIAARQQIINDLYRIMAVTGYPRVDISVLEEVIRKNSPAVLRENPQAYTAYVNSEVAKIKAAYSQLRPDQAFIHTDATKVEIINDSNPSAGLQIDGVIATLDAQNIAALKVMAVVVGKGGTSQVASTEARLFALSADQLNEPLESMLSQALTLGCRLAGFPGRILVKFPPAELRPALELEPQLTMKASRLKTDLSLGLITDDHYHMEMYGRPRPDTSPELSGTGFMEKVEPGAEVDPTDISSNGDPLGRSLTSPDADSSKSNTVKKPGGGNATKPARDAARGR
jgi:hypothetical protein